APPPTSTDVMSHGPLMLLPDQVSTGTPSSLRTIRQPASAVADVPSVVGRLPTTTHPPGRTANAVVRPTPPGHAPGSLAPSWAKVVTDPDGATSTMVVP